MNIDAVTQDLRRYDEEFSRDMQRQDAVERASAQIGEMTVDELSRLIDWMRQRSPEMSFNHTKAQLALRLLDSVMQDASELMLDVGEEVYP